MRVSSEGTQEQGMGALEGARRSETRGACQPVEFDRRKPWE